MVPYFGALFRGNAILKPIYDALLGTLLEKINFLLKKVLIYEKGSLKKGTI